MTLVWQDGVQLETVVEARLGKRRTKGGSDPMLRTFGSGHFDKRLAQEHSATFVKYGFAYSYGSAQRQFNLKPKTNGLGYTVREARKRNWAVVGPKQERVAEVGIADDEPAYRNVSIGRRHDIDAALLPLNLLD